MRERTIAIRSRELTLEGQLVAPTDPRCAVVLCHGIPSGRPSDPDDPGYAGLARDLAARGYAALWFNFRGTRGSPGEFSIEGWVSDVEGAVDALAETFVAAIPIVLVGSSAGGVATIVAGARRPSVAAVGTLAAPASWEVGSSPDEIASTIGYFRNLGIIHDPAYPVHPEAWVEEFRRTAPERHVGAIAPRPLLLVHGEADDVVPYPNAERLFARAGEPKELVRIPHGGHQLRRDPRAIDALYDWLERIERRVAR